MNLREAAEALLIDYDSIELEEGSYKVAWPQMEALRKALADPYEEIAAGYRKDVEAMDEASKTEPVTSTDDDEVLYWHDEEKPQRRFWWSGGAYLYPGDCVVVRRNALAHGRVP